MRTQEERVLSLYLRMAERNRMRERRKNGACVLVALLVFMVGAAAAVLLIRRRKASEHADDPDVEGTGRNEEEHL